MRIYFRYFIILALLGCLLTYLALGVLLEEVINKRLLESAQRESMSLGHMLAMEIRTHPEIQGKLNTQSVKALQRSNAFTRLDILARNYAKGFGALQVILYNADGLILYSTDRNQIGQHKPSIRTYLNNRQGRPSSQLKSKPHFYTLSGVTMDRDVVSTYVPVALKGGHGVDALIQVYVDVTGRVMTKFSLNERFHIIVALVLLGLFGLFYAMVEWGRRLFRTHDRVLAAQQQEIFRITNEDRLTGLPNRASFRERLRTAMQNAQDKERLLAVIMLDLEHFILINDVFGVSGGDAVLNETAMRLRSCASASGLVSRLRGSSFTIVFENVLIADEVEEAANHILDVMSSPFHMEGQALYVSYSLGVALYPFGDEDENVDSLIHKSEMALEQAKQAGRNTYRFYSSGKREKLVTQFTLENALRQAIKQDEFHVYFQPVVQMVSGRIVGVEALLRWHSPDHGVIPPLEFISALENSGLIVEVGRRVLDTACRQVRDWQLQGYEDLKVNVNISAKQFRDERLLDFVDEALEVSGLYPAHLNLEITESLLLENRKKVIRILDRLNEKGVAMSVDDFGTGYSSIAYLKDMPIETIKIDKSFVRGIPHDMDDIAIINTIDYLSRNLRLNVIAEGVETMEQLNFLRKLNIFAIQGYLVSRPLPADEMQNLLYRHQPIRYQAV